MSDIANASLEQAAGIDQINKALAQMDEVTQQNSALVEENAATAKMLEDQSSALDGRRAVFQLEAESAAPSPGLRVVNVRLSFSSAASSPSVKLGPTIDAEPPTADDVVV